MKYYDSQAVVLSNEWVNDEYKHMVVFVGSEAATVEPGQFFNLMCPSTDKATPFFRRPMSTYFANSATGQIEFLYKVVGIGTEGLSTLQAQQTFKMLGPLGHGFNLKPTDKHILVLGRGVGLATLAPLAEYAASKNVRVTAILSAKDKERLMSQHRFADAKAAIIEVIDSDRSSAIDHVDALIRDVHHQQPIDAFFTCGSKRIGKLLQQLALELGIRGEVALEQNMACGIGMCHACVIAIKDQAQTQLVSKKVCKDGPVFDIREIVYE
ncbi:dihydroorotate dehydrogenase electron transfer subunit [Orbus hercynius]|uniref:Dihydroorotate dehydrogenase electron transfer subunit n=1 Tax=Orbus hercynius TaxID=593135 RepID=A0A495RCH9_9GAMM|nr:dihydroorotate dehydrogenase electron transfer subunit [Orbus hercynius]RKS85172.1 dihydroorotate dehydrogenase electron transfer subunit [Orbus hercynius]